MTVLVVEGGALRASYAAGVLDALQDAGCVPRAVYATSAGAAAAAWFASGQARAGADTWARVRDSPFVSYRRALLRRGPLLDFRWLYHHAYPVLLGLDVDAVRRAPYPLLATVTDARSGDAAYVDVRHAPDPLDVLRATSAIPLLAEAPVDVNGARWFDGGLADPIPLARAIADGARDVLLIANRPLGKREPEPWFVPALVGLRFPALKRLVVEHHARHDAALALAARPPPGVRVRVVRPSRDLGVGRLTRDPARVRAAVAEGRRDGARAAEDVGETPTGAGGEPPHRNPETPGRPSRGR